MKNFINIQKVSVQQNIFTFVLLAVFAFFGMEEAVAMAMAASVMELWFFIKEIATGVNKKRYWGNAILYLLSGLAFALPWLEGLTEAVKPLIDAILTGDISNAWPLLLPIINEVISLFQRKPWQQE